jgi:hypothetical protein
MRRDAPAATLRRLGLVAVDVRAAPVVVAIDVVVEVELHPRQDLLPAQAAGHASTPYPLLP